ncbi:MAG TPA: hypothetical protein VGW34_03230 [Allosphingosinicella sp.]|nr:hypothetical protein [Allosphingosinicella sp.]
MSALLELAARVEAATGPDRELDRAICLATDPHYMAEFTKSLDAAMTLVSEGWDWQVIARATGDATGIVYEFEAAPPFRSYNSEAATPALALVAACLRAREAA